MKTNPTRKTIIILAVTISATFVVPLVNAQVAAAPTHNILFEETSSNTMTATYDGTPVSVSLNGTDRWAITFANVSFTSTAAGAWVEPGSALFNFVGVGPGTSNILFVNSDVTSTATMFQDESSSSPTSFGTDTRDGGQIFVTFDDDGDMPATAPDTGSTLGLLALALAALFGTSRFRSLRLA